MGVSQITIINDYSIDRSIVDTIILTVFLESKTYC